MRISYEHLSWQTNPSPKTRTAQTCGTLAPSGKIPSPWTSSQSTDKHSGQNQQTKFTRDSIALGRQLRSSLTHDKRQHPHLHTIVPAGGWNETAQYWKTSRKNFFIPVKVISAVFRGKFLSLLKQAYCQGQLKFAGEIEPLGLKNNFKQLLEALYSKPWVVFAKKPFKNAGHIVSYLGRYSHRVAIGNNRLLGIEGDQVAFKWKDYKDHSKQKIMRLAATEFIRRFLLHILPKGFCKIRYFGIFACRNRKTVLTKCSKALGYSFKKSRFADLSWKQSLMLVSGGNLQNVTSLTVLFESIQKVFLL